MRYLILFLVILVSLETSCTSQPRALKADNPDSIIGIDDLGREVRFSHPPERIISLDPSITEMLFALGLSKEVVGVTEYCDYPEEAKCKSKVGGYLNPNIEVVALLEPDLVVTTLKTDTPKLIKRLENFRIKVFVLDPERIEDIFENIYLLGRLTYREEKAKQLVGALKERLYEVERRVGGIYRPGVFLGIGAEPLISVGPGSFANDLIEKAGGRNVASHSNTRYKRYGIEEVLLADPEVIIICSMVPNDPCIAQKRWWNRWKDISAVRNGRIYVVEANLITRPGPRLIDGLVKIAKAIHPEVFLEREEWSH